MVDASLQINQAINAYNSAAKSVGSAVEETSNSSGGDDFAALVKGAINEAVRIGERSESLSIAGINDRADLTQVVMAVAEAEVTLETVVRVRDKVIESYRQIMRMPM